MPRARKPTSPSVPVPAVVSGSVPESVPDTSKTLRSQYVSKLKTATFGITFVMITSLVCLIGTLLWMNFSSDRWHMLLAIVLFLLMFVLCISLRFTTAIMPKYVCRYVLRDELT